MKYFTDKEGNLYDENQKLIAKSWEFSSDENWNISLKSQEGGDQVSDNQVNTITWDNNNIQNQNWTFEIKDSAFFRIKQSVNICFDHWKVLLAIPLIYLLLLTIVIITLPLIAWLMIFVLWIFLTLGLIYAISQIDKTWNVSMWNVFSYANNNLFRYFWVIIKSAWYIFWIPLVALIMVTSIYYFTWAWLLWWPLDALNLSDLTASINWANIDTFSGNWTQINPELSSGILKMAMGNIMSYIFWIVWFLFFIPFIIYRSVKVFASMYIAVSENKNWSESVIWSIEITKWNLWRIIWNFILIWIVWALITWIPSMLLGWFWMAGPISISEIILIPFQCFQLAINVIFAYLLYKVLKENYLLKNQWLQV